MIQSNDNRRPSAGELPGPATVRAIARLAVLRAAGPRLAETRPVGPLSRLANRVRTMLGIPAGTGAPV